MDGHEARTKSLDARIVLVAIRLVDLALTAEFRFERMDGNTIGGLRRDAAAFAHQIVDEDALRWIRIQPPLAAAAFLGGACLIVDQDGKTADFTQLALNPVHLPAMMDRGSLWKITSAGIFAGIVRDDRNALRAFSPNLMGNLRDGQTALGGLSAGHGDRIVVKNLVGDVDARSRRGPQCEQTRMCAGAVPEVVN